MKPLLGFSIALGLCLPALAAPATDQINHSFESPWADLVVDAKDGVLIRAKVLFTRRGYAVEFRNDGSTTVAFNFILKDILTRLEGEQIGVISLIPGSESGMILVPFRGNRPPFTAIELFHIRLGNEDQGLLWRE